MRPAGAGRILIKENLFFSKKNKKVIKENREYPTSGSSRKSQIVNIKFINNLRQGLFKNDMRLS